MTCTYSFDLGGLPIAAIAVFYQCSGIAVTGKNITATLDAEGYLRALFALAAAYERIGQRAYCATIAERVTAYGPGKDGH